MTAALLAIVIAQAGLEMLLQEFDPLDFWETDAITMECDEVCQAMHQRRIRRQREFQEMIDAIVEREVAERCGKKGDDD